MATFITPVRRMPGATGAWTDVDVSADIPSNATGVILHLVNDEAVANSLAVRMNGSTDNRTGAYSAAIKHQWAAIGVDGSRIFEAFLSDTVNQDIYLIGYFTTDAVFFTNGTAKATANINIWEDVNISGDTTGGDVAIAAIVEIGNGGGTSNWGLRKNGSTDARIQDDAAGHPVYGIIGVDASEIFEQNIAATTLDLFLLGYIKSNGTFNTNAPDRTPGTASTWLNMTALPASSTGGVYEFGVGTDAAGIRKDASTEDIRPSTKHHFGVSECDTSTLIVEGWSAVNTTNIWEIGSFTASPAAVTAFPPLPTITREAPRRAASW